MAAAKPTVRRATPVAAKPSGRAPPPVPPTRMQVVNRLGPTPPVAPSPAPPTVAPTAEAPRTGGLTFEGMLGIAVLVVAATVLVLNFTLPWSTQGRGFGPDLDRSGVANVFKDQSFYLRGLVLWPVVVTIGAAVMGAVLVATDFLGLARSPARALRLLALGGLAVFAFLLLLMASRFLGYYLVTSMGDQQFDSPLAAPYVNLAAGLLLLGAASWRLGARLAFGLGTPATPAIRTTFLSLGVVALVLLLDPLLPLGRLSITGAGTTYLGEGLLSAAEGLLKKASDDLGFALGTLWVAFYLLVASAVAAVAARESPTRMWSTLVQVQAFNLVPLVIGLVFSVLLFTNLDRSVGGFGLGVTSKPSFNVLLPLGFLALIGLYARFAMRVLGPFLRAAAREAPDAS